MKLVKAVWKAKKGLWKCQLIDAAGRKHKVSITDSQLAHLMRHKQG